MAMQATLPLDRPITIARNLPRQAPPPPDLSSATTEIEAYLAARDVFLREAEAKASETNLRRAEVANDFAEDCLQPARAPFQAQTLPAAKAAWERQRCHAIKRRLAELRASAGLRAQAA